MDHAESGCASPWNLSAPCRYSLVNCYLLAGLLPDDIADELAHLQDKVAPFPGESAIKIIEEELQADIATAFQTFDSEPLAAASVAQVHAITLNDGEEAVVKVLRPGIEKQIAGRYSSSQANCRLDQPAI